MRLSTKMSDPVAALLPSNIIEVYSNKTSCINCHNMYMLTYVLDDDDEMIHYPYCHVV